MCVYLSRYEIRLNELGGGESDVFIHWWNKILGTQLCTVSLKTTHSTISIESIILPISPRITLYNINSFGK